MILGIILLNTTKKQVVKWAVRVLWGLNGFVLAPGAGCSFSTIIRWLPKSKQATWIGYWSASCTLGGALAATIAGLIAQKWFGGNPGGFFVVPGLIACIIGIWGMWFGADEPQELGWNDAATVFEEAEKKKEEGDDKKKGKNSSSPQSRGSSLVNNILKNPWILLLACSNVFVYVIRLGVSAWVIQYASIVLDHSVMRSTTFLLVFELAATVGGSLFGWLSDRMNGRCMLLSSILMLMTTGGVYVYSCARSIVSLYVAMGVCGFLIYGPHLLTGVSAAKFVPREAVAMVGGVTGTFGYLLGDSLLAKYVLPVFVIGAKDSLEEWHKMFFVMYLAAVVGSVLMALVAIGEEKRIGKAKSEKKKEDKKIEKKEKKKRKEEKKKKKKEKKKKGHTRKKKKRRRNRKRRRWKRQSYCHLSWIQRRQRRMMKR